MSEPIKREGAAYICEILATDRMRVYGETIWIVGPDRPPRVVLPDGRVKVLNNLGEFS